MPGSGLTLPLNLHAIAARLTNAYFAPKRFAAVQVAFNNPRCRVLVFHTGRLVGTGCSGPMAARMAILKAVRQLAREAKVYVHIRKFQVINQVGAVSINAKLDCDAFASTHSATSHYDRASFVGLAWRPGGESICCEIVRRAPITSPLHNSLADASWSCARAQYSTGKANLPGSTRQRDLLNSFSRMVPELLRHSDRSEICDLIPEHLRLCHRPQNAMRDDAPVLARSKTKTKAVAPARATVADLFGVDGDWSLGPLNPVTLDVEQEPVDDDDDMLALAGF